MSTWSTIQIKALKLYQMNLFCLYSSYIVCMSMHDKVTTMDNDIDLNKIIRKGKRYHLHVYLAGVQNSPMPINS